MDSYYIDNVVLQVVILNFDELEILEMIGENIKLLQIFSQILL